jgi:hypothetical protein
LAIRLVMKAVLPALERPAIAMVAVLVFQVAAT